jgi:hypothetical protein
MPVGVGNPDSHSDQSRAGTRLDGVRPPKFGALCGKSFAGRGIAAGSSATSPSCHALAAPNAPTCIGAILAVPLNRRAPLDDQPAALALERRKLQPRENGEGGGARTRSWTGIEFAVDGRLQPPGSPRPIQPTTADAKAGR